MARAQQTKLGIGIDLTALENEVYLTCTSLAATYDKGDFIAALRSQGHYAIPYKGEKVKLYWANYDHSYIKSSERLRDYALTVHGKDGKTIRIKLVEADTEKDNVKAKADEALGALCWTPRSPLAVVDGELHIRFFDVPAGQANPGGPEGRRGGQDDFSAGRVQGRLAALRVKTPTSKNPNR